MSIFIKKPIIIPNNIIISINNKKNCIFFKNIINNLSNIFYYNKFIKININNNFIYISTKFIFKKNNYALIGTTKSIIINIINGLIKDYLIKLLLIGIEYSVHIDKNIIFLSLGYSNIIEYKLPNIVKAECENKNEICLRSIDKQAIGQVASDLTLLRKYNSYKGKGIIYINKKIKLKEYKKK